MISIHTSESTNPTAALIAAIQGARLSYDSAHKSDSTGGALGEADRSLALRLARSGASHAKFLRQVPVMMTVTAPLFWWKEYATYKVGTTENSTSTMHRSMAKPFSMEDFSTDTLTPLARKSLEFTIAALNELREKYLETKDPDLWRSIICLLPESYLQTRYCSTNYAALINIYHQRRNHRLYEWHDFCEWIRDLPHMADFLLASN